MRTIWTDIRVCLERACHASELFNWVLQVNLFLQPQAWYTTELHYTQEIKNQIHVLFEVRVRVAVTLLHDVVTVFLKNKCTTTYSYSLWLKAFHVHVLHAA